MKPIETVQVRNLSAGAVCVAHVTLAGREVGAINAKRFEVWFDKGGKRLFDAGILERVGAAPAEVKAKSEPVPVEPAAVEPVVVDAPAPAPEPEAPSEPVEVEDEGRRPRSRRR